MPLVPKTPQARDLVIGVTMCGAVLAVALTVFSIIPPRAAASCETFVLLALGSASLLAALPIIGSYLLARPYELSIPFSPPWLIGVATIDLLLAIALARSGYRSSLLPLLSAFLLVGLSRGLRIMRRKCTFCGSPWRSRQLLVAGDGFIVCDQCVDAAVAERPSVFDATGPRLVCKACAAHLPVSQYPLQAPGAAVCFSCAVLAHQVISQGRQS